MILKKKSKIKNNRQEIIQWIYSQRSLKIKNNRREIVLKNDNERNHEIVQ